jgi:hypothetical protein
MKRHRVFDLLTGLSAVLLIGVAFLLWNQSQSVAGGLSEGREGVDPEGRVVAVMQKMEVHVERLYYSGRDQDWSVARQALQEVSGAASRLYGRKILYGQVGISEAAESVLPDEFRRLENAIDLRDRDAFLAEYKRMILVCNSCHRATGQLAVVQEPPPRERRDLR